MNYQLITCDYVSSVILSLFDLSKYLIQVSGLSDRSSSIIISLLVSFIGISKYFRNIVSLSIISIDVIYLTVTALQNENYAIKLSEIISIDKMNQFTLVLKPLLLITNNFLVLVLLSILSRSIESSYGPAKISDIHSTFTSIEYILRYSLRKVRQLIEFFIYSAIPAFFICMYINNQLMETIRLDSDLVCRNWSELIETLKNYYDQEDIRKFLFVLMFCVILQRVFGSNPSYKPSIDHQYGEVLKNDILKLNKENNLSNEQKSNVKRRKPTEIYSLIGGLPDVDRTRKTMKNKDTNVN